MSYQTIIRTDGFAFPQRTILQVVLILLSVWLHRVAWSQTVETTTSNGALTPEGWQENWTSFRGPGANGHAAAANLPLSWSVKQSKNIAWKTPIAKHGMSSPVVWNDRLFLTAADEESRDIYCIDTETGKRIWEHQVSHLPGAPDDGRLPEVLEEAGFAAPTVATNGQIVAAIFATGELVCVDMNGERIWAKHLGIPDNHYGHSSSLVCSPDLLFVQFDQKKDSRLFAFEIATGKQVWKADRDEMSWSSPILVENNGRAELILTDNKFVCGYAPKTGKRLWRVECLGGEVAPSAAYAGGIVFVAVENAAASAIDVGKHSDEPKVLWQWDESLPDSASPVANDKYVILPTAFGVVTCLDAKTGKVFWEHEFDNGFCSSPILMNDRVYIVDLSGNMHIFRAAAEFESIGGGDTGEPVYATPAFVGNRIYIRGLRHLYCVAAKEN